MKSFGEKLRELRKSQGKSQTEVVNEISRDYPHVKFSQTTLSTLEQRAILPREDILEVLADYFNVPVGYFNDSDDDQLGRAKDYLESLADRRVDTRTVRTHTNDNSATEIKIEDNAKFWQPRYEEDEWLEE